MFLSHPLVEVLVGRGVEDIDALLQVPTWNDLPPILFRLRQWKKPRLVSLGLFGIANALPSTGTMTVMEILGAHILRSALTSLGVAPRTYLPHRDEGYGLSSPTVHHFHAREPTCSSQSITASTLGCRAVGTAARDRRRGDRSPPYSGAGRDHGNMV